MTDLKLAAQRALNLMDLTTLNDDDTDQKVIDLCRKAKSPAGLTAAVCIYPRFIPIARKTLREIGAADVRIATVTNFPHGNDDIEIAVAETRAAVAYGADEVDVVFPYRAFMAGNEQVGFDLVKACKEACGATVLLKVIIDVYHGGPVGIEALAATLNEQASTLVETVEPYLLQTGFLARTPSGRRATARAYEHLGLVAPAHPSQPRLEF